MAQTQMIEGTAEEISALLQGSAFAGRRLQVVIQAEDTELLEDDLSGDFTDLPNTVRDRAHLLELLQAGLDSPKHPVTQETWDALRSRGRERGSTAS